MHMAESAQARSVLREVAQHVCGATQLGCCGFHPTTSRSSRHVGWNIGLEATYDRTAKSELGFPPGTLSRRDDRLSCLKAPSIDSAALLGHLSLSSTNAGPRFASEYRLPLGVPVLISHMSNLCGMSRMSEFHPLSRDMRLHGPWLQTREQETSCCSAAIHQSISMSRT